MYPNQFTLFFTNMRKCVQLHHILMSSCTPLYLHLPVSDTSAHSHSFCTSHSDRHLLSTGSFFIQSHCTTSLHAVQQSAPCHFHLLRSPPKETGFPPVFCCYTDFTHFQGFNLTALLLSQEIIIITNTKY